MKSALLSLASVGLLGAFVACTSGPANTQTADPNAPGAEGPGTGQDGESKDPNDPANQPPHSLGTITLGESHVAGTGTSSPIVVATFVPDAAKTHTCKKKLDAGCEIFEVPKCADKGCAQGEACVFDDSCSPTCKKIPVCSMQCDAGEVCTLDDAGKAECTKAESFDAGPLAFSGTTTPITLFPPYQYKSDGKGAPFLAGAEIKIQAQGATGAGFEKFEDTFKATNFLQTTPMLNKIDRDVVFGSGPLPISWAKGEDAVVITVSGAGGSVTCKAKDADGKFDLPRSAMDAALGEQQTANFLSTLSLSVTRQRTETKKDKKAKGPLSSVEVQPEGWVDLITLSTESASFQGCAGGKTTCGTSCNDLQTDSRNCGKCGLSCKAGVMCAAGTCKEPTCPIGQLFCSSTCTDVQKDKYNCGACGKTCVGSLVCSAGTCQAPATTCPVVGQTLCSGVCTNVQTDGSNCGTCGTKCAAGMTCSGGTCQSGNPVVACNSCIELQKSSVGCKASWTTCAADVECKALETCMGACTNATCYQTCQTQHPNGVTKAQPFEQCAVTACQTVCQ